MFINFKFGPVVAIGLALIANVASAAVTYNFTGQPYTDVRGVYANEDLTHDNKFSGFVTFKTAPAANQIFTHEDILAFSLDDGYRTLSSANGAQLAGENDYFTFDASLRIVDWYLMLLPAGVTNTGPYLITTTNFDVTRLSASTADSASNRIGGSWAAVPEPTSLAMLTLAGGTLLLRRRH